jgi:hypothetical protein
MAITPTWRDMTDSDGSKISLLTVNYEVWLRGINDMSRTNFQVEPGVIYLVPTYAAREIDFDADIDGITPFSLEYAELKEEAGNGWNRPGAIADYKRGILRWESPVSKGVLSAKRSGKKGGWTVELESPPIMGRRHHYKHQNPIPDEDFADIINNVFEWFNLAKAAVYHEWLQEPFVVAVNIIGDDGKPEMGVGVFGERNLAQMWENIGAMNLGWFKVTNPEGKSPSKLNMALLAMAFHESWLQNKIIVEGQVMAKNTGEHQWWMIEGAEDNVKGFIRSAKRSTLHWVSDDLFDESKLLRVYLNIQPVEKHFVESITTKLQLTPTMLENEIAFVPAPCGTNTTNLKSHQSGGENRKPCKSCQTIRKNQEKAVLSSTEVVSSTDPRSGPVVTVEKAKTKIINAPSKSVESTDLQALANDYFTKSEYHQAEAHRFLELAEKCELLLKPSTELEELRAKLEAAEKAAEEQRQKDLAEIEAARQALV